MYDCLVVTREEKKKEKKEKEKKNGKMDLEKIDKDKLENLITIERMCTRVPGRVSDRI